MKLKSIHELYYSATKPVLLKMHSDTMLASDDIFAQDFQIYSAELLDAALCYTNGKVSISFCMNHREQFLVYYLIFFLGLSLTSPVTQVTLLCHLFYPAVKWFIELCV